MNPPESFDPVSTGIERLWRFWRISSGSLTLALLLTWAAASYLWMSFVITTRSTHFVIAARSGELVLASPTSTGKPPGITSSISVNRFSTRVFGEFSFQSPPGYRFSTTIPFWFITLVAMASLSAWGLLIRHKINKLKP